MKLHFPTLNILRPEQKVIKKNLSKTKDQLNAFRSNAC